MEAWPTLTDEEMRENIATSERHIIEDLFLHLNINYKAQLLTYVKPYQRWSLVRLLAPDDLADLIQSNQDLSKEDILNSLDDLTRAEVKALLVYKEDQAGGRMNSRYARLRPEMTVEESISYLRALTRNQAESIYQCYIVNESNVLLGAISLRQLFSTPNKSLVGDVMVKGENLVKVPEHMDQEEIVRLFKKKSFTVLPVVDLEDHIMGVVTVDDFVKVVQEVDVTGLIIYFTVASAILSGTLL